VKVVCKLIVLEHLALNEIISIIQGSSHEIIEKFVDFLHEHSYFFSRCFHYKCTTKINHINFEKGDNLYALIREVSFQHLYLEKA
jgi:hypothetical protein